MPYYTVRKKDGGEPQSLPRMSHEELQKFLADNQEYEQVIVNAPAVKVH